MLYVILRKEDVLNAEIITGIEAILYHEKVYTEQDIQNMRDTYTELTNLFVPYKKRVKLTFVGWLIKEQGFTESPYRTFDIYY